MVDIDQLREHLRIDDESEDNYLDNLLIDVADYLKAITGIANDNTAPPRYDRAVLLLAAHWHGTRSAVVEGQRAEVPLAFKMIVSTLRTGVGIKRNSNGN